MTNIEKDISHAIELLNRASEIFNRIGMEWVNEEFISPSVEAVENWSDEDQGEWS